MPNDGATCATAIDLVFSADASVSVTGDTRDGGNDNTTTTSQCEVGGPDRVYTFSVGSDAVGEFAMTANYPQAVVVHGPSTTCGTAPRLACQGVPGIPGIGTFPVGVAGVRLAPGTYWVWADGPSAGGTYTLSASVRPALEPTSEDCMSPAPLSFVGNTATATGSTRGRINDSRTNTCGGGRGDVVYEFSLPATTPVTARVTTTTTRYTPVVYFRSGCTGAELGCAQGSQQLTVTLDAGTHYVWVDGVQEQYGMATDGDFTLTLTR